MHPLGGAGASVGAAVGYRGMSGAPTAHMALPSPSSIGKMHEHQEGRPSCPSRGQGRTGSWASCCPPEDGSQGDLPGSQGWGRKGVGFPGLSVSPGPGSPAPPPPIIGLPAPLPSACNFLPRRWREGNVKDDGLKGAVGVRRGGTTGLEGKRNRRKEGALNKADTKREGDRKLDGEGRTWRL